MKTVRLTMAQALIRYLVAQMLMDEKKESAFVCRCLRYFRPWQCSRLRRGAISSAPFSAYLT